MATDSTTAGFLAPSEPNPVYDIALEDIFQAAVRGITGVVGNLVRPRWQVNPGNMPSAETDWISFTVRLGSKQWNAYQKFDKNLGPEGSYIVEGVEEILVTVSFYGPNNFSNQRRFEDGLQLEQNRQPLADEGIVFRAADTPVNLPALFKEKWYMRSDLPCHFHRWVRRVYPVRTILSADVDLNNEKYVEHISVTPPTP